MRTEALAVVRGWDETRRTLACWRRRPRAVLVPWALVAVAVSALLLAAVWAVAVRSTPDPFDAGFPGVTAPATGADYAFVLYRNGLVLALHALACVAGFLAGSSLPTVAEGYSGRWRTLHEKAGPVAIAFVLAATAFSLATQAYALGRGAADLAAALGVPPAVLLLALLPHALPELTALFLPLAAWTLAARRGAWHELLAATVLTVTVAAPVLVAAAAVETWLTPAILRGIGRYTF